MSVAYEVDYDFCKTAKLTYKDLLIWLDLNFEYSICELEDVYLRQIGVNGHLIQLSQPKKDFDRWANSVDTEWDLSRRRERKEFIDFIQQKRELTE